MTELRPITVKNFDDIISLRVAEHQQKLVASNVESIAQAWVQPGCTPLAIYHDGGPVGFIMYCIDVDDGEYWLYRFMIDRHYQGRGYGRQALTQVLERVKADQSRHKIFLGVEPDGGASLALYQSLGFRFDGRICEGEHIMVLEY